MKKYPPDLYNKIWAKATQSPSMYRLGGVAFNEKGEVLGYARNSWRNDAIEGKGTGRHVEANLIARYKGNVHTIIIMRIGGAGDILPIEPCPKCRKLAEKMGVKIYSVKPCTPPDWILKKNEEQEESSQ